MSGLLKWISLNPAVAAAVIGGVFAVLGGFFVVVVWPLLADAIRNISDAIHTNLSGSHFENKFLEWVIHEHQYLPILPTTLVPVTEGHQHELDRIYVALTVADGQQAVGLSDVLQEDPKLVILGDPGAGKTTMLRFLALTFARARRNKAMGVSSVSRREDAIRIQQARERVRIDFGLPTYPLPIFVYLNRLRDVAEWPKGRSLLDALRDEWKAVDRLRKFPDGFFDVRLARGQCIFLFDAFDELGTQEARDAIARHIGELANTAPSGNRFITTSRLVGYNGQLAQYGFGAVTVQRLSWKLISELVSKWYVTLKEPGLATDLLEALENSPRISELATNPMLLSLIVLVQYVKRIIPDRRDVLYDECVKILVERRFAPPSVQAMFNATLDARDAVSILQKIARALHEQHLREVPRGDLESLVTSRIVQAMPKSRASTLAAGEIIRNIEQRSQILVERGLNENGKPVLAFSHMTFQEYLTAVDMKESATSRGRASVTEELLRSYELDAQWWEEVALLYAAQLDPTEQDAFFQLLYPN